MKEVYCLSYTSFKITILQTYVDVAYLLRREDNPRYGEEGFYDPTCETEWHREIIKIYIDNKIVGVNIIDCLLKDI